MIRGRFCSCSLAVLTLLVALVSGQREGSESEGIRAIQDLCETGALDGAADIGLRLVAQRDQGAKQGQDAGRNHQQADLSRLLKECVREYSRLFHRNQLEDAEVKGLIKLMGVAIEADGAPGDADLYDWRGSLLARQGASMMQAATGVASQHKSSETLMKATKDFSRTTLLQPTNGRNWYNLGNTLDLLKPGPNPEAVDAYSKVISLAAAPRSSKPLVGRAHLKRALLTMTASDDGVEAVWQDLLAFIRLLPVADLYAPTTPAWDVMLGPKFQDSPDIFSSKVTHLCLQLDHLLQKGVIAQHDHSAVASSLGNLRAVAKSMKEERTLGALRHLGSSPQKAFYGLWNRVLYHPALASPNTGRCDGACLNPNIDWSEVESHYFHPDNAPGLVVVDDWLTPSALEALRGLAHDATIWTDEKRGYLGSRISQGLANFAMVSIARELSLAIPKILCSYRLRQAWSYKYDQAMQNKYGPEDSGIGLHADPAAVNVNWWVSEDGADGGSDGGGMVVYLKEAPPSWSFSDFQTPSKIQTLLESGGSKVAKRVISHKPNRLVLFKSSLFHQTDRMDFRPGYKSRRINFTYLFGQRGIGCVPVEPPDEDSLKDEL